VYVGQSGRSININHKEYVRYIGTNNLQSGYALHILQNRHEYGSIIDTLQLLKTCSKGTHMNCWEALYMQEFHQHGILIAEQQVSDSNPLYELINATKHRTHIRNRALFTTQHNTTQHNTVRINSHQSNKPNYLCTKLM